MRSRGHLATLNQLANGAVSGDPLEATMNIIIPDSFVKQMKQPNPAETFLVWEDEERKPTSPTKLPESEF